MEHVWPNWEIQIHDLLVVGNNRHAVPGVVALGLEGQMSQTPEGWKEVPLSDLLTPKQIKRVMEIIKDKNQEKKLNNLKEYFYSIRKELDKKGIDDRYLAYAIYYKLCKVE